MKPDKTATVFRMQKSFFAVVQQGNAKIAEKCFSSRKDAINWLYDEHYDITRLRITTEPLTTCTREYDV